MSLNVSSAANLTCSRDTVVGYSRLCLGESPPDDCYPTAARGLTEAALIANLALGVAGNLLTLIAIPYAMHRKRYVHM